MAYAALHPNCESVTDPSADDIARLAADPKQPGLIVFTLRHTDLTLFAPLAHSLEILKTSGAPQLTSLDGVERLTGLREFVLASPTGSAGSGRSIAIESFTPLARLDQLQRLVLHDVRPADLDLAPIMRMTHLRELHITGVPEFTIEHYAQLAVALPGTTGPSLVPYVTIRGIGRCKKCGGQQALLVGTAPRARKWLCPTCNAKPFRAHVARWEELTGRPFKPEPPDESR